LTRQLKQNKTTSRKISTKWNITQALDYNSDRDCRPKQRNKIEKRKIKSRLQKEKAKLDAQLKEEEFQGLEQELKLKKLKLKKLKLKKLKLKKLKLKNE
jgi:hypothetical protein